MVRSWQLLVCWVLLVGSAAADNWIYGYTEDGAFAIEQVEQKVAISAPGSYLFWATDDADPDGLGLIKKICVDSGVPGNPQVAGTVTVGV